MECAFKSECIWYNLPNELVRKIAGLCWANELHRRYIKVLPYTQHRTSRGEKANTIIFVYDPAQDAQARAAFFRDVVPLMNLTRVKIIIIFNNTTTLNK